MAQGVFGGGLVDGGSTSSCREEVKGVWRRLGRDGSSELTFDDVYHIPFVNSVCSKEEAQGLFNELDTDDSGLVRFDDLIDFLFSEAAQVDDADHEGTKTALTAEECARFSSPEAFRDCLTKRWVCLLRGSFLVQLHDQGRFLDRHQDLPEDAFWGAEEAMDRLTSEGNKFLYVLSYRWLQPGNPDPQGHHLKIVAHVARCAIRIRSGRDIAVFWDFGSLPQKPRSAEEDNRFRKGLGSCDMLYGHRFSNIWMQTRLPAGFDGASYDDSGWCSFEAGVSAIVKDFTMRADVGKFSEHEKDYQLGVQCARMKSRRPAPLTPERFGEKLEHKVFTNKADSGSVLQLYRRTFEAAANSAVKLHFANCRWGPAEAEVLADALPHFRSLQELNIVNNPFGNAGLAHLASALPQCASLKVLNIRATDLETEAIERLAEALPQMQSLEELDISDNRQLGAAGLERLSVALPDCQALQALALTKTGIDAKDLLAMAPIVARCPKLRKIQAAGVVNRPFKERWQPLCPDCEVAADGYRP